MKIVIKNRFTKEIILSGKYNSIQDCLKKNSRVSFRGADLRGAYLSQADLSAVDLSQADLSGANLFGANLRWTNLFGANLRWSNLCGADLYQVKLWGADLYGANLFGVKGIKLPIISIQGSDHTFQYISGKIKIGCEFHTVKKWLKDYKKIGKRYSYTSAQIEEYGEYIKMCARFAK